MLVSSKGRYALRVLIDIAQNQNADYVTLREIADRQEISKKYLESIMSILVKNKLVESSHGKGGGYRLNRDPDKYTVLEILKLTEETLAPVACLKEGVEICKRCGYCSTLPMWNEVNNIILDYFRNKTIADLMINKTFNDYII